MTESHTNDLPDELYQPARLEAMDPETTRVLLSEHMGIDLAAVPLDLVQSTATELLVCKGRDVMLIDLADALLKKVGVDPRHVDLSAVEPLLAVIDDKKLRSAGQVLGEVCTALQGKTAGELRRLLGGKPLQKAAEAGRNDPCPCGSGKKFKKCCMRAS